MKSRKTAAIITAALIFSIFAGCNNISVEPAASTVSSATASTETQASGSKVTASAVESDSSIESADNAQLSANDYFTGRDLLPEYNGDEVTKITCKDNEFTVAGTGADVKEKVLTIHSEGVYVLSGTVDDGRIEVNAGEKDKVQLVLDGFNISCSNHAPILVNSADKVFITLENGTTNTVTDSDSYTALAEDESSVDAAIFSHADLVINGSGSLDVSGNMSHAIVSKDDLKITGGSITVTSVGSAICGKDSVRVAGGEITVTSGGDGIKSDNAEDTSKGYIYIGGGKINVTADNDGIQAETTLVCENAEITVNTGGGSENAAAKSGNNFGGWGKWSNMEGTAYTEESEDSTSAKGLKAGGDITICSCMVNADCADDTIHSNSNVTVESGSLLLKSGDDGIHSDSTTTINDGKITVTESYEGLEGSNVVINGGEIDITASDDGINAAGGDDIGMPGGAFGQDSFSQSSGYDVKITGGTVKVDSVGDGLDSNGTITVTGGTVYVDGPSDSGNAAIDCDGSSTISGGTVVAVGCSGMAQGFSSDSKQASILYNLSNSHSAGDEIILLNESGEELVKYTAEKTFNSVNISTPKLTDSGTYTLKVGDESFSIEMTSNTYSNGGGMGMGGSNMHGGGRGGMMNNPPNMPQA